MPAHELAAASEPRTSDVLRIIALVAFAATFLLTPHSTAFRVAELVMGGALFADWIVNRRAGIRGIGLTLAGLLGFLLAAIAIFLLLR